MNTINQQFETQREAIEAAKHITAQTKQTMLVYFFPKAIPARARVVDETTALKYNGVQWARLVFTTHA